MSRKKLLALTAVALAGLALAAMITASIVSPNDDASPENHLPDFTESGIAELAQDRVDDSRHFDIACAAEYFADDVWVATCSAIERGCADLRVGDDLLANCIAIARCEDAEDVIVRSKCTDTERQYVFRFDDRDGRFIE